MSGVIEYTLRAGFDIRTELASTGSGISYTQTAWSDTACVVMYWSSERFHLSHQRASRNKDRISGVYNTFNTRAFSLNIF